MARGCNALEINLFTPFPQPGVLSEKIEFVSFLVFLLFAVVVFLLPFFILTQGLAFYSPQESEKDGAMVKVQVLIECLREGQANILNKLKDEISSRHDTSFDTNFFTIQYAGKKWYLST